MTAITIVKTSHWTWVHVVSLVSRSDLFFSSVQRTSNRHKDLDKRCMEYYASAYCRPELPVLTPAWNDRQYTECAMPPPPFIPTMITLSWLRMDGKDTPPTTHSSTTNLFKISRCGWLLPLPPLPRKNPWYNRRRRNAGIWSKTGVGRRSIIFQYWLC